MPPHVDIYDVTLRDGAQGSGVKFTADDQLRIITELDAFGIPYIEGGQAGANPKAQDLFARAKNLPLKQALLAAFGSTRHPKSSVETDPGVAALLAAETPIVTIFAKTWRLHVREVLRVSLSENLRLVEETVTYLRKHDRRVFFDAEHFFDGYADDPQYAMSVLGAAVDSGAEVLALCDTNGGRLPWEIELAVRAVCEKFPSTTIGIHVHNDSGCGVANSLAAVHAGCAHVQGTINGYGERTGNANLCAIIPDLQLKMGCEVVSPDRLRTLTRLSHLVAELANLSPRESDPFVGKSAFTHKAGMHADAVRKLSESYEHVPPESVGNRRTIPVSEMSGRTSLLHKAAELGIELDRDNPNTRRILDRVKELEKDGYEFEGADASLELLMRKARGEHRPFFSLHGFHVSVTRWASDQPPLSEATVKIDLPNGERVHTASEGHGPVDALNSALRKALEGEYPELCMVHLEDYKVRILDTQSATRAVTRVLIESTDGEENWNTVGVSENIIAASYEALVDSIEYKLLRSRGYIQS